MRGVIEGFYGPPWSHEARLSMLRWLSQVGLDSYVYAPKRDPLHRGRRWVEPYPSDELGRFEELFGAGEDARVGVTFAVAPARVFGRNNISRWWDKDGDGIHDGLLAALLAKLAALQGAGGRSFALLFDDTAATFVPSLAGTSMGRFHGRIGRRCLDSLRAVDPEASLFLVPSVYSKTWDKLGGPGRAYWRGLADELPEDVPVAWTGPRIFSRDIRGADVRRIREETGLPVMIWNNAVVNDWVNLATGEAAGLKQGWRKLSFGPGNNLDAGVLEESAGVVLNGALEPELTKVSASCFADFVADPAGYDADSSHSAALERLAGPEGAMLLDRVYELCRRNLMAAPDRQEARELYRAAKAGDREGVRRELDAIVALADGADAGLPPELLAEVQPTLRKAGLMARAGLGDRRSRAEAKRIKWFVARKPFQLVAKLK